MATEVVMPQMGESIAEGTIVRWIKKVGDQVERDEPLFEISTDKVDAEIPSPAAGVVTEIRVQEGETVGVNTVVGVIGEAAAAPEPPAKPAAAPPPAVSRPAVAPPPPPPPPAPAPPSSSGRPAEASVPSTPTPSAAPSPAASGASLEEVIRQRSSPLVRRIAKEHQVDISRLQGTGIAGRVTKQDILNYISTGQRTEGKGRRAEGMGQRAVAPPALTEDRLEKMSVMRKRIAEHMVLSRRTSAHVHSVFEVNFSRIAAVRESLKGEFEASGVKLTFLSFIAQAVAGGLRATPIINTSIDGDNVVYHKDVNIGIAVALDWGLIVPVVKQADQKDLLELSRSIADLASRARAKQLKPEEVSGGTFTITNPGVFGALFGMPIINQPQVAILGVGNIEKRPVVINDAIAIRPMAYLTLGYDHRLIDGAVADEFMSHLKTHLENWNPEA